MKQQQVSVAHHRRPVARGESPSVLNVSTLGPIVASAVRTTGHLSAGPASGRRLPSETAQALEPEVAASASSPRVVTRRALPSASR